VKEVLIGVGIGTLILLALPWIFKFYWLYLGWVIP